MRTPDSPGTFKDTLWIQVFVQQLPRRDPSLVEATELGDSFAAAHRADRIVSIVEKQLAIESADKLLTEEASDK